MLLNRLIDIDLSAFWQNRGGPNLAWLTEKYLLERLKRYATDEELRVYMVLVKIDFVYFVKIYIQRCSVF